MLKVEEKDCHSKLVLKVKAAVLKIRLFQGSDWIAASARSTTPNHSALHSARSESNYSTLPSSNNTADVVAGAASDSNNKQHRQPHVRFSREAILNDLMSHPTQKQAQHHHQQQQPHQSNHRNYNISDSSRSSNKSYSTHTAAPAIAASVRSNKPLFEVK